MRGTFTIWHEPGLHALTAQARLRPSIRATIRMDLGRVGSRRVAGFEWSRRFLDPPYHSVRRVFPRYGWKAGLSSGAFLNNRQLKPAPGVRRPLFSLHPLFVHLVVAPLLRSRAVT